jgi:hypothetical protein
MRYAGTVCGFLALTLFLLPALPAQEKKGDAKADEKKEPEKKETVKEKKEPEKKETVKEKKEKKPAEEMPEHGPVVKTRILSMRPESSRDFTIEVPMPDPQQMYQLQVWQAQQMQQIATAPNAQQYAQRMAQYQMQLAQKQASGAGYTKKPVDVRAAESCKVRIMKPQDRYDDTGNIKKWTKKELDALKANSKLPGFPGDFDMLKPGQYVEVYLAKAHGSPKDKWAGPKDKKKKKDDDPPEPMPETRPEVVMIVIWGEPMR